MSSTELSDASEAYGFGLIEPNTRGHRNGWNGLEFASDGHALRSDEIEMSEAIS